MANRILIKCPTCATYFEGKLGFMSAGTVRCKCGTKINLKDQRYQSKKCAFCENTIICDVTDTEAKCPICNHYVNKKEDMISNVDLHCPECNALFTVNKNATVATCPMCNVKIEVKELLKKLEAKERTEVSLIKYNGGKNMFVWKHPIENFPVGSQLIVGESQEAIFYRDGVAYDSYEAGRYTLNAGSMPKLEEISHYGNNAAVTTEIYFINKVVQTNLKWGTDTKIRLLDPESNLYMELGAFGTFNLAVSNGKKLLTTMVGSEKSFSTSDITGVGGFGEDYVVGKFKNLVMNKVKSNLARIIINSKISVITVDQYLDLISDKLRVEINEVLGEYGLFMPQFFITGIVFPEEDPNFRRLKQQYAERTLRIREEEIRAAEARAKRERMTIEHETQARLNAIDVESEANTARARAKAEADTVRILSDAETEAYRKKSQAEADDMKAKNYTYQQETSRIIGQEAVSGKSAGIAADMVGLGISLGAANAAANIVKTATNPLTENLSGGWTCPKCGKTGNTTKFCPDCGEQKPN